MRRMLCTATLLLAVSSLVPRISNSSDLPGIPPETVADYIHAIIEADRTFYTIHVVEPLQKNGGPAAAENWRAKKNVLPLPAQFLIEASDLAMKTGLKVRYRLISLWPINPHNRPYNKSEKDGLEAAWNKRGRGIKGVGSLSLDSIAVISLNIRHASTPTSRCRRSCLPCPEPPRRTTPALYQGR